jgi:hypothetical protein
MSSGAQNDEEKGVSDSGNQPNNTSENGGQDPRIANVILAVEEDEPFVPPTSAEACQACSIFETENNELVSQLTEKDEEISNLTHSLRAKHTELDSLKKRKTRLSFTENTS